MRIVTTFALITLLLAACGFKGPLYLPDSKAAPTKASAPAAQP